ncbi:acyl-CoA thioesterase [Sandarakinorhabdus sp.]|jgi:acyl-CoA thioester hydrolase|uniref:acyl-CoA thioesterase n=1 Tax=Sandarakinorhabdus sp. TaxID=1916663 RepID=UPI003340C13E
MRGDPGRLLAETYPARLDLPTRFGDMDANGHLNNVAIAQLFEEARVQFNTGTARLFAGPRPRFMVAHVGIDYLAEGHYPHAVALMLGVSHIGTSSFRMAMAAFQAERCIALSDAVLVVRGPDGGAAPLPAILRERLEAHRLLG